MNKLYILYFFFGNFVMESSTAIGNTSLQLIMKVEPVMLSWTWLMDYVGKIKKTDEDGKQIILWILFIEKMPFKKFLKEIQEIQNFFHLHLPPKKLAEKLEIYELW